MAREKITAPLKHKHFKKCSIKNSKLLENKIFKSTFYDDNDDVMTLVEGEIADEIMDEQNMMDNMGQDMLGMVDFTDDLDADNDAAELDFELQMIEEYRMQTEMDQMHHMLDCELEELDKTFARQSQEQCGKHGHI